MTFQRQQKGASGEKYAARHLAKKGYKIIARNYRTRLGEIDIIARDKDVLVFIEVKTRTTSAYGNPKAAVHFAKQKKISLVALEYLKKNDQMNEKARFDVVAVEMINDKPKIEIVKSAFELAYH